MAGKGLATRMYEVDVGGRTVLVEASGPAKAVLRVVRAIRAGAKVGVAGSKRCVELAAMGVPTMMDGDELRESLDGDDGAAGPVLDLTAASWKAATGTGAVAP